jgi:hypothetical protein
LAHKETAHVERLTLEPGCKSWCGEEVVHPHRELKALPLRVECLEVQDADPVHRWLLDLLDEAGQVEVTARFPRGVEQRRQQDVFTRRCAISAVRGVLMVLTQRPPQHKVTSSASVAVETDILPGTSRLAVRRLPTHLIAAPR